MNCHLEFEVRSWPENLHIAPLSSGFGDERMLCVIRKNSVAKREDSFCT